MDHSYRAALAGGNNGHKGGGRQRPGFAAQYPQPEPEPLPMNGDANSRIFAFIEDLFFMAKIVDLLGGLPFHALRRALSMHECRGSKYQCGDRDDPYATNRGPNHRTNHPTNQ